MTTSQSAIETPTSSVNNYKNLCETVLLFCEAKSLDKKSREQLATIIGLAIRVGENGIAEGNKRDQKWPCPEGDCTEGDCECECGQTLSEEQAKRLHLCDRCGYLAARC